MAIASDHSAWYDIPLPNYCLANFHTLDFNRALLISVLNASWPNAARRCRESSSISKTPSVRDRPPCCCTHSARNLHSKVKTDAPGNLRRELKRNWCGMAGIGQKKGLSRLEEWDSGKNGGGRVWALGRGRVLISMKAAQCLLHAKARTRKCRISIMFTFSFTKHITVRNIGLISIPGA